jgi:signal peptide peptidase SppA
MSCSESFVKEMFTSFCKTLFKVLGFGLGVVLLCIGFGAFFGGGQGVPHQTTARVLPNDSWKVRPFSQETPTILRIDISNVIGLDHMTKDEVKLQLMESVEGELRPGQVKGVFVTINTPGGMAEQSDSIYRYIKMYKERYNVPVYAFVNGLCASGGMYVACAADKVYATQDSLIGHVGVLLSPPFFNFSQLMSKLGVQSKTMSAGKDKDSMSPFRPWKDGEGQQFQYLVDFMYSRFLDIVSTNRPKLTREDLIEQGARLWPAPDAERLGYIDGTLSGSDEALKNFATDLGIHENYQFVELERRPFLQELFGLSAISPIFSGKVDHHVRLPGDVDPKLSGEFLYLYQP